MFSLLSNKHYLKVNAFNFRLIFTEYVAAVILGGAKKRPELCVTIRARILYRDKFPFVHL